MLLAKIELPLMVVAPPPERRMPLLVSVSAPVSARSTSPDVANFSVLTETAPCPVIELETWLLLPLLSDEPALTKPLSVP